jgi:hypothetical protein
MFKYKFKILNEIKLIYFVKIPFIYIEFRLLIHECKIKKIK